MAVRPRAQLTGNSRLGHSSECQVDAAAILEERRGAGEDAVDAVIAEARWSAHDEDIAGGELQADPLTLTAS